MPHNSFNLPTGAIESRVIDAEPLEVFFPKGTVLVDKDGCVYKAEEILSSDDLFFDKTRQYYGVVDRNGMHGKRREFSLLEIQQLDIRVAWYPQEDKDE